MANNLTYDEWVTKYSPYLGATDSGNENGLFEIYGKDLEFISKSHSNLIWTLCDCDGKLVLTNGYRYINRVNYMISRKPWTEDIEVLYSS